MTALSRVPFVMFIAALAAAGCSRSSSEKPSAGSGSAGSATPAGSAAGSGSGSGSAAGSAEAPPVEAAAVVGPTKSATGVLTATGKVAGSFEWKKKDQKSPISCAWDAEKEIGGARVDLSDGAGHLLTIAVDVPPGELGPPRLDAMSTDLPGPQTTHKGFKVRGDEEGHIKVVFENAVFPEPPDEPAGKKAKKPAAPPTDAILTLAGTLEVSCPATK